jgi:hypothetical protein
VEKDFHLEVIQVKEEREKKQSTGGFQRTEATGKSSSSYKACHTNFCTYPRFIVDSHVYPWVTEGKSHVWVIEGKT